MKALAQNIQETSARLSSTAKESFPRGGVALEYLALAEAALEYTAGPPQELQRASGRLARRSAALIYERHPEWEQKWGPSGREKCVDDGLYHLSFLADALALGRPESFASYCAWMADFLERRGMSRGHLEEMIAAISDGLGADEAVSGELKTSATKTLQGGRDAIIRANLPRA